MKSLIKAGLVTAALALTAGCYYDPYYVRSDGYYGDAYYGTSYYDGGYYPTYYSPGYYYDPYYYWGPSIGLGFYYSDRGHRHHGSWGHGGWDGGHHGSWSHGGSHHGSSTWQRGSRPGPSRPHR